MEKYKIEVKKSAVKELNAIPPKDLKKVLKKIRDLSDNPRPQGCIKLTNQENYRIRMGNYRILYSIEDDILTVYVDELLRRKQLSITRN
jgi:mRNA interferase RelE/StbE